MSSKLDSKVIKIKCCLSNERRCLKKSWWSDELSTLWNNYVQGGDRWRAATSIPHKAKLKEDMRNT